MVNDDFVDLNKTINHTLKNEIENDEFVVAIQSGNEVNANEKHLS